MRKILISIAALTVLVPVVHAETILDGQTQVMYKSVYDTDGNGIIDAVDYTALHSLSADTAPTTDDVVMTENDPAGTHGLKQVTLGNLSKGLVGINETYGSGWNADTGLPEKDDIYDYLHLIDTDDDGSLIDEAALTGAFESIWSGKSAASLGTGSAGTATITGNTSGIDPVMTFNGTTGNVDFSGGITVAAVASPQSLMADSDAPDATDPYVAAFRGNFISGADNAENGDWFLDAWIAGTQTATLWFDVANSYHHFVYGSLYDLDDKIYFGDTTEYICSNDDEYMDLNAATAIRINGNVTANADSTQVWLGTGILGDIEDLTDEIAGSIAEGEIANSVIVSADIKDADIAAADLAPAVKDVDQEASLGDAGTLTPTAGYHEIDIELTCTADPSAIVIAETGAIDHASAKITNVGANTCTFADINTTFETPNNSTITLEQYEAIEMRYEDDRWVYPGTSNISVASIQLPYTTSGDQTLTEAKIGQKSDEDMLVGHGGATGEVQDEYGISMLDHIVWSGDPGNAYDSDAEAFIMTLGDDYPHGLHIVEWKCSCNLNPDVEINADLRYADSFLTLANAADIDEIDTTDGASTEDTNANINGGAAVANGKVIYIGFDGDPEGTCTQMIFEMWGYREED